MTLINYGWLTSQLNQIDRAEEALSESLMLFRRIGERRTIRTQSTYSVCWPGDGVTRNVLRLCSWRGLCLAVILAPSLRLSTV